MVYFCATGETPDLQNEEEEQMSFSKKDTSAVKGIAILLMFAYHCFSTIDRMQGVDVSFYPFSKEFGMYLAGQMNVCVSMFLFLSVYGMTVSAKKAFPDYRMTSRQCTEFVCVRYIKLMSSFWIPFAFCEVASLILSPSSFSAYGSSVPRVAANMAVEALGLSEFFGTAKHIGTWWYISLAVLLVVLLPLLLAVYRRFGGLVLIGLFVMLPPMLLDTGKNMSRYLLVVPLAICCADQGILERYKNWSWCKKPVLDGLLKVTWTLLLAAAVAYVRKSSWGVKYMEYPLVGLLGFLLILLAYSILDHMKPVQRVLIYLVNHSGDMFFIHTFFRGIWFEGWLYSFKHALLIELVLVAATLLCSHFLDLVRRVIRYPKIIQWASDLALRTVTGTAEENRKPMTKS